jgi:hypothetical protein
MNNKPELMSKDDFREFYNSLWELDDQNEDKLRSESKYEHEVKESFPYIPFGDFTALHTLFVSIKSRDAERGTQTSLLDVGAGTGRIVCLAKKFGIPAKGIEFYEPYVLLGRKTHELSDEELILGNAFDMTPEFLQEFGVIYTYMPLLDTSRMTELHFSMVNKLQNRKYVHGQEIFMVEMYPMYYPMNIFYESPPKNSLALCGHTAIAMIPSLYRRDSQ